MSNEKPAGYLPGDPRYGLQGEALANYYRTKAAQWAIYCWDIGERSDAVLRTAHGERIIDARARRRAWFDFTDHAAACRLVGIAR